VTSPFEDDEEMIGPMPSPGHDPDLSGIGPAGAHILSRENQKKTAELENLYEWTEKYEYQPGVQYIRVSRAYPKVWEGVPIAGIIEDVHEPFDSDYLVETWGGGTYKLAAIQLDPDGKSRTVDRKTITIQGLPYAFRGQDGTPHPLPQSQSIRDNMRYRQDRDEERDIGEGFRQAETVTAADLYNIAAANNSNRGGTDPETLEVLRNAQNDVQNHMQKAMEQQANLHQSTIQAQREEMQMMRERISDQSDQAQAPFQHAMSMMENRGNIEMQMMQSQLDAMRSEHTNQMQMMQNEHGRVIDSLQREADRMRDDSRMREENIRASVAGQYQGQLAAMESRLQMNETTAQNQILMARQDADRREAQMKMMLESSFGTQSTLLVSERDRLAMESTSLKSELDSYRQIVMDKQDPIANMERMQTLMSAVQGFGGGGGGGAGDIPEDLFGKIAHYGPGLAKNFLGPILSRVDNATSVAKQAVDMQQAQQAEQAQYFQPQALPMQQMPTPQDNPYMQQPVAAPAPEPIPQGDPLTVFLENQLQANNSPETAVQLLGSALANDEIPQESLMEFASMEDHQVIDVLMGKAMDARMDNLPTPRGRHFLTATFKIIKENLNSE